MRILGIDDHETKIISLEKDWMAFLYGVIGILLLFDPFEHFTFHVRILGLEMISYVFVRKRSIRLRES